MRTLVTIGLVILLLWVPASAVWGFHGHHHGHARHHHGGLVLGGIFAGLGTLVLLNALAQPPVIVERPPACRWVWIEGRWTERWVNHGGGFSTREMVWVPGQWVWRCG